MPQLAEVVTIKKHMQIVPWSEVEPLFNQAIQATNSNITQVLAVIGYSSSSVYANWRDRGQAPVRAKYALLGLLSELRVKVERPVEKQFTFEELTGLFAALQGWPVPDETRRTLTKKIANAI